MKLEADSLQHNPIETLSDQVEHLRADLYRRDSVLKLVLDLTRESGVPSDWEAFFGPPGDQLRELFHANLVEIFLYDPEQDLLSTLYASRCGERLRPAPQPGGALVRHLTETGKALILCSGAENAQLMEAVRDPGSAREGPEGSHAWLPVRAEARLLGALHMARNAPGAFEPEELEWMQVLTGALGLALQSEERRAKNCRLIGEAQQRRNELAILNSVGEAMARTLDIKTVTRIIGDKVLGMFDSDSAIIMRLDRAAQLIHIEYEYDRNEGGYIDYAEPFPLGVGLSSKVISSAQPLMLGTLEEEVANGAYFPPEIIEKGTGFFSQSWLGVPIIINDQVLGLVALADGQPHAFNENHLRLLQTLSTNIGIAMENARLFEAQQQRLAELDTINTVSSALVRELDTEALIQLVGEQLRSVFKADIAYVALLDQDTGVIRFPYHFGQDLDPIRLGEGLTSQIIQSGKPLLINQDLQQRRQEIGAAHLGREARSYVGVPIFVGGEAIGVASVQNATREDVFSENDLQLLNTIAASIGIALDNARLFDELKRQKQDAQEARRRLSDIINFLPDATLVIDDHGRVMAWNHAIEQMTGIPAAEMLGKGDYEYALPFYGERRPILIDLVLLPSQELERKYVQIQRLGGILSGETYTPALRDGARYLYATASALHDSEGRVMGAIETIRDNTDRKKTQEELSQAKAEAEQANRAKSAFLATMSHEIRTPMNAVIGMSGLLLDTQLNKEQREYAETIRNSGDALLAVINDILDFSKIEAEKLELERQPFNLRECIESALDLVSSRAAEKGLELAYLLEDDLPRGICGDLTRLRQILLNLLSNAVKFTEKGEVVLTVKKGRHKQELHFSVRDTGVGIPADRIKLLFQSFTQADSSTTRKYGGTGLGLAISQRLVHLMGGEIRVESEGIPGKGSTFLFTIHATPAPVPSRILRDDGAGRSLLLGRRLLIVDDNPTNRRILRLQTQKWGMHPRDTGSPRQALKWLGAGQCFDLAILDMRMPEMDGVELAAAIHELPGAMRMPLALLSSLGPRETHTEGAHFAVQLHKPLKPSQLFDALIAVFGESRADEISPAARASRFDASLGRKHPLRILVAEDNLVNQKVALRILEQSGYRADVASNGREALECIARQPYDVVLMDVQMPEMDGLEATHQVLARWPEQAERPAIIAMTADAMQGDREMCLAAGMDDYVAKPIRVSELTEALLKVRPRR